MPNKKYVYNSAEEAEFLSYILILWDYTLQWYPASRSRAENKLRTYLNWLKNHHDVNIIYLCNQSFEECRNPTTNRKLFFDFIIPSLKLIIEVDGPHHFKSIRKSNVKEQQKRDQIKEDFAIKHGYGILRILDVDIIEDRINWRWYIRDLLTHPWEYQNNVTRLYTINDILDIINN